MTELSLSEILDKLAYELIHSIRQAQEDDWTSEEAKQVQDAKIAEALHSLQVKIDEARIDELERIMHPTHIDPNDVIERIHELKAKKDRQQG